MKNYDPNINSGDHTVRVYLQTWGYKGSVDLVVRGNCHGKEIIGTAMEAISDSFCEGDEDLFLKNDINLRIKNIGRETYVVTGCLTDENGKTLELEEDADDMHRYIVGAEIIQYDKAQKAREE
jgi:hypothetical protein